MNFHSSFQNKKKKKDYLYQKVFAKGFIELIPKGFQHPIIKKIGGKSKYVYYSLLCTKL